MHSALGVAHLAEQPLPPHENKQKLPILAELIQGFGQVQYEYLQTIGYSRPSLDFHAKAIDDADAKTLRDQSPLFTFDELERLRTFSKTYNKVRRLEYPFCLEVQTQYALQISGQMSNTGAKEDQKEEGISSEMVLKVADLAERYMKVLMSEVNYPTNDKAEAIVLNKLRPKLVKALLEGDRSADWPDELFEFVKFMETPLGARYSAMELAWLQNVRAFKHRL